MALPGGQFDLLALSRSIDQARSERGLTWTQLSGEVGVSTSTIRRFATAADAEADGVLALIGWLGVVPEEFIADSKVAGVQLPEAGNGQIRVAMAALKELPGFGATTKGSTRTTIQRLVTAAQESLMPVASVVRRSPV